jgi:hypothetical protein
MQSPFISQIRALLRRLGLPLQAHSLVEVSVLELRTSRIGNQQKIGTLNRQIEAIEVNKAALFQKGVDSTSKATRVEISKHLHILDLDIAGKNKILNLLFKELEAITGLLILKENQDLIRQNGLTSIIARISLEQLTDFVREATVEGDLHWGKLKVLCDELADSRQVEHVESDPDRMKYLQAMEEESNSRLSEAVTESLQASRKSHPLYSAHTHT